MDEIKKCERCHEVISDVNCSDWFSHIRVKYCDTCREIVRREKEAERMRKYRAEKSAEKKRRLERAGLLEEENRLLREQIALLMEYNEKLKAELKFYAK